MLPIGRGTVVGERYVVQDLLGDGGLARVFRVEHRHLGTTHALKVLRVGNPSLRDRLMREGRAQSVVQHPNVVPVTDVVTIAGTPALVMEYVAGPTLRDWLAAVRPTLPQADAIARGLLAGVEAAHAAGLVHRDLKPDNVLLALDEEQITPKITDLGLVKALREAGTLATRTGATMGTPSYMAPEQIADASKVDERADVFSLGAILYELVTGRVAFEGDHMFAIFRRIERAEHTSLDRMELPDRMREAIEGALVADRDARIPDIASLRRAWEGDASPPEPATAWTEADLRCAAEARPARPALMETPPAEITTDLAPSEGSDPTWYDTVTSLAPPRRGRGLWLGTAGLLAIALLGAGGVAARAIYQQSRSPEALEQRAIAALGRGDLDAARRFGRHSGTPMGLLIAARVHFADGQFETAVALLTAIEDSPGEAGVEAREYLALARSGDVLAAGLAESTALYKVGEEDVACEVAADLVISWPEASAEHDQLSFRWIGRCVEARPATAELLLRDAFPALAVNPDALEGAHAVVSGDLDSARAALGRLREHAEFDVYRLAATGVTEDPFLRRMLFDL